LFERIVVSFFIDNWLLITIAIVSAAMLLWPTVSKGAYAGGLNPNEVVLLMNREKAVVIDVCEPNEYAAGHIKNAKNLPVSRLEAELTQTVKNKGLPLVLVCATGVRSNRAVAIAQKLGYEKAQSLSGGMGAWRETGLPIEKA
jgi:rhodanese-related sulfurtransferase